MADVRVWVTVTEDSRRRSVRLTPVVNTVVLGIALLSFGTGAAVLYKYLRPSPGLPVSPARMWVSLAGLIGFGTMLVHAVRWRFQWKLAVLGLLFAVTGAVYGYEVYLTMAQPELPPGSLHFDSATPERRAAIVRMAKRAGASFDGRTRLAVLTDLRAQGTDVTLGTLPRDLLEEGADGLRTSRLRIRGRELLPLGVVPDRTLLFCNETGEWLTYRTDRYGFRNPPGVWDSVPAELAVLGNSFALGGCVADGKGFVDLVRSRYHGTLNVSIGGHGPLMQLAALKEYVARMRPPLVLWTYEEDDDLGHLAGEKRAPLLRRYLEPGFSQGLPELRDDIAEILRRHSEDTISALRSRTRDSAISVSGSAAADVVGHLKLGLVRKRLGLSLADTPQRVVPASDLDLLRTVLTEASSVVADWQGTIYFVYLPAYSRYASGGSPYTRARDDVLGIVTALGLPVIDLEPAFRDGGAPLSLFPFQRFIHYNERGHDLVARTILQAIHQDVIRARERRWMHRPPRRARLTD